MRRVISVLGLFVLVLILACGDSPEPKEQPTQPAEQSLVMPSSWALPEEQFSEETLILPVRAFQGSEFPTLDSLDPRKYVTFTKRDDGRYHGSIGGIFFILELS